MRNRMPLVIRGLFALTLFSMFLALCMGAIGCKGGQTGEGADATQEEKAASEAQMKAEMQGKFGADGPTPDEMGKESTKPAGGC